MELFYTKAFKKSLRTLPTIQRDKLRLLLKLLQSDPFHPQLHSKPLAGRLSGSYSFRINREWRVLFELTDSRTVTLFNVAHRKDIYR